MVPGMHAMLFAMFDAREALDREAMRRQVEWCIAAKVAGVSALGLATEVSKLSEAERRTVMDWTAADVGGRVPLSFTIFGGSVAEQVSQIRHAEGLGADAAILQPPMTGSYSGPELVRFFGRVADASRLPISIQNAPAYIGRGLTPDEITLLVRNHPNVTLLKGEGPVVDIERIIAANGDKIAVFNGRGGLELVDNFRAGCAGMILAPDMVDHAVAIEAAFKAGEEAEAERRYAAILPAIVFAMQSVETLITYAKRIFAARAGLTVHDRAPALAPTPFGLAAVERYAALLGPNAGLAKG